MMPMQHQAPDTTSPSPPHPYPTNGSAVPNTNGFPPAMIPQGKFTSNINDRPLFNAFHHPLENFSSIYSCFCFIY